MKDAEIDYSDIPALDKSFFTKATEAWPQRKSNSPSVLTRTCWNGSERMVRVIRRASITFCGPRWKARPPFELHGNAEKRHLGKHQAKVSVTFHKK